MKAWTRELQIPDIHHWQSQPRLTTKVKTRPTSLKRHQGILPAVPPQISLFCNLHVDHNQEERKRHQKTKQANMRQMQRTSVGGWVGIAI